MGNMMGRNFPNKLFEEHAQVEKHTEKSQTKTRTKNQLQKVSLRIPRVRVTCACLRRCRLEMACADLRNCSLLQETATRS